MERDIKNSLAWIASIVLVVVVLTYWGDDLYKLGEPVRRFIAGLLG